MTTGADRVEECEFPHQHEGWYTRVSCGQCGEIFEVEDDVMHGEEQECDLCGLVAPVVKFG